MFAFAVALTLAQAAAAPETEPFVGQTIPETQSIVFCPSAEAAARMLDDYYEAGPHILDTARFFEGLRETGCTQEGGPVTVDRIDQARTFPLGGGPETHIRFEGRTASGTLVQAIVDTKAFRPPASELDSFLELVGSEGDIELNEELDLRCPTLAAARAVVQGVPEDGSNSERRARFDAIASAQGCTSATGTVRVTGVFEWIGFESPDGPYNYQVLSAAVDGQEVGLLFSFAI
ncbi:hypothetical protein RCO27_03570 [Sphingosinicella sp. LHD-64]|uniref:hypothetical protein n=1 Tax=Sphingosinicella sp. LHD-64 TaxID=3072139 RepID=UPI00280DB8E6|nr:hypothetical protein [Sphingosinicella sp. LHD-64]MDQ8755300.1 hypothetical protein [Sphingosinicella sp. LHD-64]